MCGIAGIYSLKEFRNELVKEMADVQSHRGPDGEGFYINDEENFGFGHRRLSIIDLSTGEQPMHDKHKKAVITYNGEIYNYKELRNILVNKGYEFLSNSDTEVILNAYLEWGTDCILKLRGMFAFVMWDFANKLMFMARDPFGIKPLHYFYNKDTFAFSSELKGLLPVIKNDKPLNMESVNNFFRLGYIPAPLTIYENCNKLLPGHYAIIKKQEKGLNIERKKYYEFKFNSIDISESEAIDLTEKSISNSVKNHMVSDVPIGFFLSGGIDSSLVSYYGSKLIDSPINAFTMDFDNVDYSELHLASEIANKIRANHSIDTLEYPDIFEYIPKIVDMYDEPFADSSAIPTYLVSKAISGKYKVALSGDGGDEFFGGYSRYRAALDYQKKYKVLIASFFKILYKVWPIQWKKDTLRYLGAFPVERFIDGLHIYFTDSQIKQLFNDNSYSTNPMFLEHIARDLDYSNNNLLDKIQNIDILSYLHEDNLTKVDRASMASSLEVRVPFIDVEVAKVAKQLPKRFRVKDLQKDSMKYILRRIIAKNVSEKVAYGRKKGFSIPLKDWLDKDKVSGVFDTYFANNGNIATMFNHSYINALINEHFNKKHNHQSRLWALLVFFEWYSRHQK